MENTKLSWFILRLSVYGVKGDTDPSADIDFLDEISFRPYLKTIRLDWDKELQKLDIVVKTEGLDEAWVTNQVAEELFEVANAVLTNIEGLYINVVEVIKAE